MIKIYGIFDNDMDGYGNNIITRLITEDHKIINIQHPEKVYEALVSIKDELLKYSKDDNVYLFINDLGLGQNTKVFDVLDEIVNIKIVINDHHEPNDNLVDYYKKKRANEALDLISSNYKDRLVSLKDRIEYGVNFNIQKGNPKATSATEIFYNLVLNFRILEIFDTTIKDKLKDIVKLIMLFDTFRCMTEDYISPYFKTDALTFNKISDIIDKDLWIDKLVKFITTKTITNDADIDMNLVDLAKQALTMDKESYEKCYETLIPINFDGYKVGLTFYNKRGGLLGEHIRKRYIEDKREDLDFIMVANYPSIGIYSIKDINLSEVARKHGGGGHPNAAGFPTKDYNEFIDIISGKR